LDRGAAATEQETIPSVTLASKGNRLAEQAQAHIDNWSRSLDTSGFGRIQVAIYPSRQTPGKFDKQLGLHAGAQSADCGGK
jgi:hypothetical protein